MLFKITGAAIYFVGSESKGQSKGPGTTYFSKQAKRSVGGFNSLELHWIEVVQDLLA